MYQIIEIRTAGNAIFHDGLHLSHAMAIKAIESRFGSIMSAEHDFDEPECLDVMTDGFRQFAIQPAKELRENNEQARWYDTSAE